MSLLESLLENGQPTDATLSKLVAIFGSPQAGQVVHEMLQVLADLTATQPETPQVSEADAHSAQAGAQWIEGIFQG